MQVLLTSTVCSHHPILVRAVIPFMIPANPLKHRSGT